ncbi:hypothetical protein ACF1B0_22150 [Streptomyces anandii]|uniref:hypothetical protein n=1 Tax=Streptomyces anandii TaxID=285454 RepID=UPI0036FA25BA
MTEHRREAPGENGAPVPRDMPDQQVQEGEDPWDAAPVRRGKRREADAGAPAQDAQDVPDSDEAGAGPKGAARPATVHPEHPAPDESPG